MTKMPGIYGHTVQRERECCLVGASTGRRERETSAIAAYKLTKLKKREALAKKKCAVDENKKTKKM